MDIEPLALVALFVVLLASLTLCGVLGVAVRRGSHRALTAASPPPRELIAAEVDRTRREYEIQLTRVCGERDQALSDSRFLHTRLTQLEAGVEARVAAEVDARLGAALEAKVEAGIEARVAAVLEARIEAGVAARLAEALASAAARFGSRNADDAQEPPGEPPLSPAVPHQLPLGRDSTADTTVDGADLGPVVVRAASVRGDRQREDGEHRRDAVMLWLVEEIPSPTLLSAVAAGAPRGLWSQSAAQRACRSLAAQLGRYGERLGSELYPAPFPGADPDADRTWASTPTSYGTSREGATTTHWANCCVSPSRAWADPWAWWRATRRAVRAWAPVAPARRPMPRLRSRSPDCCPSWVIISGVSTWLSASATVPSCGSGTAPGRRSSPALGRRGFRPPRQSSAGRVSIPDRTTSWPCAARPWRNCFSAQISAAGSHSGGRAGVRI